MPKRLHITTSIKAIMLFAVAFATLTISSCKKDSENGPSLSVSAKIDGTATTFSTTVLGFKGSSGGQDFTGIQGIAADGTSISLTIYGTLIAGKTYTGTSADNEKGLLLYSTKDDEDYMLDVGDGSVTSTITVTSVSGKKVSGTFSGKLKEFLIGPGTPRVKVITEGKFNAEITE